MVMDIKTLTGFTVAITGGAGGLGKAIAVAFLAKGANVAVCDVNEQ
jgi:NAD(P)-dependent dehydrogenase (short-subunit alcohol dehydrogenase family)